jgi:hypothetical protein
MKFKLLLTACVLAAASLVFVMTQDGQAPGDDDAPSSPPQLSAGAWERLFHDFRWGGY